MTPYEQAYRNTPKAMLTVAMFCNKCINVPSKMVVSSMVPKGCVWSPSLTCKICGHVEIVDIQVSDIKM